MSGPISMQADEIAAKLEPHVLHRAEWRRRLLEFVLPRLRSVDPMEPVMDMIMAGLDEAYDDGMLDAAKLVGQIASGRPDITALPIVEKAIRNLHDLNRKGHNDCAC